MMMRLKLRVRKGLAGRFLKELSTFPSVRSLRQTVCGADVILTENSFQANSGRFFLASFNTVDSCPYGHWTRVTGSIAKEDIECKQSLHF